ncbi:hypothetical protein BDY24DRAFT_388965 [Mrakia frigida]|uniref:uncharacterized protein n=1 Tax=Mrakia frigida TaxID=29902 RepID=UPI003FCC0678
MPAKKAEASLPKGKTSTAKKGKTSAYNDYMKVQLALSKEQHPEKSHAIRFKEIAKSWAVSPENPKNRK